jgi:hypothetical protein
METEESSHEQFTRSLRKKKANPRLALLCACLTWKYTRRYVCPMMLQLNPYEHHPNILPENFNSGTVHGHCDLCQYSVS